MLTMTPTWKEDVSAEEKERLLLEAGTGLKEALEAISEANGYEGVEWRTFLVWTCDAIGCEEKTRERGAAGWTKAGELDFCPDHRAYRDEAAWESFKETAAAQEAARCAADEPEESVHDLLSQAADRLAALTEFETGDEELIEQLRAEAENQRRAWVSCQKAIAEVERSPRALELAERRILTNFRQDGSMFSGDPLIVSLVARELARFVGGKLYRTDAGADAVLKEAEERAAVGRGDKEGGGVLSLPKSGPAPFCLACYASGTRLLETCSNDPTTGAHILVSYTEDAARGPGLYGTSVTPSRRCSPSFPQTSRRT